MNGPAAIEIAIGETIREHAALGASVSLRLWQTLRAGKSKDWSRSYPCVDVRCAPARVDEDGVTLSGLTEIVCKVQEDDDQNHSIVSAMFEAVGEVVDGLYAQARARTGDMLTTFKTSLTENAPWMTLGGFTIEDGMPPSDADGVSEIGMALRTHYSRSDF